MPVATGQELTVYVGRISEASSAKSLRSNHRMRRKAPRFSSREL